MHTYQFTFQIKQKLFVEYFNELIQKPELDIIE